MAEVASMPKSPVPLDSIPISPSGDKQPDLDGDDKSRNDSEAVTVFHDPENFNVKHGLMHKWTLWFTKPPSGKQDWNELLKEVITFDTVEAFWGIYNNITPASELVQSSDYHLFIEGVRPEWEDPQNRYGGRWAFKSQNLDDKSWLRVLLAAIGEKLDDGDNEVMGVVFNVRKKSRIGLWTRTAGKTTPGQKGRSADESRAVLERVGRRFKSVLEIDDKEIVEFMGHSDSGSSRAKAKFSV